MNAQQQAHNKTQTSAFPLEELTELSQKLLDIAQEETQSLTTGDITSFSSLQREKAPLTQQYMHLSQAVRVDENLLNNADKNTLRQLETLQRSLMDRAQSNNTLIDKTIHKKTSGTGATLFAAQEIGQAQSNQQR
ncbi:MAG: hypothetical protein ACRBDL_04735 [Alphaproteobacteria bacterium]